MDFWQHLKSSKAIDLEGVTEGLARHLSELMLHGHSVADLLSHFADDFGHLPANKLRQLTQGHRRWQLWRRRRRTLDLQTGRGCRKRVRGRPVPGEFGTRGL